MQYIILKHPVASAPLVEGRKSRRTRWNHRIRLGVHSSALTRPPSDTSQRAAMQAAVSTIMHHHADLLHQCDGPPVDPDGASDSLRLVSIQVIVCKELTDPK